VQVGTQVSGLVTEILTDFNKSVKKGQLLRPHRPDAPGAGRA
jgi:multidrug resistance efflux pump